MARWRRAPAGREDLQAVRRRQVPAQRVGPLLPARARRPAGRQRLPRSRKDFRDAVVAARNAFATWSQASAVSARPDAVSRGGNARGPSRAVHRRARAAGRDAQPRGRRGHCDHRSARLLRGLGGQVPAGVQLGEPGRHLALQFLGARADRRRRDHRAGGERPARPRVECRACGRGRQHLCRACVEVAAARSA